MNTEAIKLLQKAAETQAERGKDYDEDDNQQERSFVKTANAFNAITGRDLNPEEICLVMVLLKNVRQFSKPNRAHYDSLIDAVSYQALMGEEVIKRYTSQAGNRSTIPVDDTEYDVIDPSPLDPI